MDEFASFPCTLSRRILANSPGRTFTIGQVDCCRWNLDLRAIRCRDIYICLKTNTYSFVTRGVSMVWQVASLTYGAGVSGRRPSQERLLSTHFSLRVACAL